MKPLALPPGWVSSPGCWVISNVDPDTPPNDAFCPDKDGINDCVLDVHVSLPSGAAILSSGTILTRNLAKVCSGTVACLKYQRLTSVGAIFWMLPIHTLVGLSFKGGTRRD